MPTGIEVIDNWSRMILLWTFEHQVLSGFLIGAPIVYWITLGLIYILANGMKIENKYGGSWAVSLVVMLIYVITPILYLYIVGYIGYLIFG